MAFYKNGSDTESVVQAMAEKKSTQILTAIKANIDGYMSGQQTYSLHQSEGTCTAFDHFIANTFSRYLNPSLIKVTNEVSWRTHSPGPNRTTTIEDVRCIVSFSSLANP